MATLIYKCPHCGTSHEVDEALVGDRIDCRNCGRPFEASMPIARPVEGADANSVPASHRVAAGEGEIEDVIIKVHPVLVRQSPLVFLLVILAIVVGLAGLLAGTILQGVLGSAVPPMVLWIAGLILLVGGLGYLGVWWVQTRFTSLTVMDHRSIFEEGFISRRTSEVRHEDVRNIKIDQGVLDRLLGVGRISISSAGQDNLEIIMAGVPQPEKIASIIRDMQ